MKFQVVVMDKKGFILEFKNFMYDDQKSMLEYVGFWTTAKEANKVEITRWNVKGERE